MNGDFRSISENIEKIRRDMEKFPQAKLMAVIKKRSGDEIEYAVRECGIDLLGENRVQEMLSHEPYFSGAKLHFIGTLQKNKVKYLIGKTDIIESVDSFELACEISKRSVAAGLESQILFEVNTGRETQKSGVMPEDLSELICRSAELPGICLRGLMTVSPRCLESAERRKYFALLRKLKDENVGYFSEPILSMGMSESYREALEEGADIVRIGTGIFGERI